MTDLHRPVYHFTTDNWMSDPIPFYADGVWHVYFQYNPSEPTWEKMHWGHAVSRDLVHWEHAGVAIAPLPDSLEEDGVWTGCVTQRADGTYAALYTGVSEAYTGVIDLTQFDQDHLLATSSDLYTWEKPSRKPLAGVRKPSGYGSCFRDPQVFTAPDGNLYLIIGGELPDKRGGAALLYRPLDETLTTWEYLHPLFEGDTNTGHDFQCPDFFPLSDGRWCLLTSCDKTWWHVGTLTDDLRFVRDAYGTCDNRYFYAAKSTVDDSGRHVLFGWIRDNRSQAEDITAGWSGVLSLPRVVTLTEHGSLAFTPAPELHALRGNYSTLEGEWDLTFDTLLEIQATFRGGSSLTLEFGEERIPITVHANANQYDFVHVYIDRSVVEVFTNRETAHTYRVFPLTPGKVRVVTLGKAFLEVWELG